MHSSVFDHELLAYRFISLSRSLFEQRLVGYCSGSGQYSRPTEVSFRAWGQKARPDDASLDDDLIKDICRRYDQATRLSHLYEKFLPELDTLYSSLAATSSNKVEESCFLLTPIVYDESIVATEQTYSTDPTFRSRFCKAVSLQAITTAAISLARLCSFSSDDAADMVAKKMNCIWTKHFEKACESAIPLSYQQQLECFEVYNFLYYFCSARLFRRAKSKHGGLILRIIGLGVTRRPNHSQANGGIP